MEQWASEKSYDERDWLYEFHIATRAAQWGADRELEACCEWIPKLTPWDADQLRAARRPKPPSLKKQALIHFESFAATFETSGGDSNLIRRALEQLND
jgi:hypothetical protein